MGSIKDFIRSMSEQRAYPYYYRLRANQRAKRRKVTAAAGFALIVLVTFISVYEIPQETVESTLATEAPAEITPTAPRPDSKDAIEPQGQKGQNEQFEILLDCITCPEITLIESDGPGEMQRLGISTTPITNTQYTDFTMATGYSASCSTGNADAPVTCISWNDTNAYIQWLILQTGKIYRLPSLEEWQKADAALGLASAVQHGWLEDCGDSPALADSGAPCHSHLLAGQGTTHAKDPLQAIEAAGFYVVRKLSRVSIY